MSHALITSLHWVRSSNEDIADQLYEEILETISVVAEHSIKARSAMADGFCAKLMQVALSGNLPFSARSEAVKTVNLLLEKCPVSTRDKLLSNVSGQLEIIQKLALLIPDAGDYELQVGLTETLFRLTTRENRHVLARAWFTDELFYDAFCRVRDSDFETDCRIFLNTVNCMNPRQQSVASFPCVNVFIGNFELQKPRDEAYSDFWVDFNRESRRISFFCAQDWSDSEVDEGSLWETVAIREDNVAACDISENDDGLIALSLQTVGNARELIGFGPEFNDNSITIIFATDARLLKMHHIIKCVQLAYPNKIAGAGKKAKVSEAEVHVQVHGGCDDNRVSAQEIADSVSESQGSLEGSQRRRHKMSVPAVAMLSPALIQAATAQTESAVTPRTKPACKPLTPKGSASKKKQTGTEPGRSKTPKRVKTPLQLVMASDDTSDTDSDPRPRSGKISRSVVDVPNAKQDTDNKVPPKRTTNAAKIQKNPGAKIQKKPAEKEKQDVVIPSSAPEERVTAAPGLHVLQLPALSKRQLRNTKDDSGISVDGLEPMDHTTISEIMPAAAHSKDSESLEELKEQLELLAEHDISTVYSKGVHKVSSTPALSTVSEEESAQASAKSHYSLVLATILEDENSQTSSQKSASKADSSEHDEDLIQPTQSPEIKKQSRRKGKSANQKARPKRSSSCENLEEVECVEESQPVEFSPPMDLDPELICKVNEKHDNMLNKLNRNDEVIECVKETQDVDCTITVIKCGNKNTMEKSVSVEDGKHPVENSEYKNGIETGIFYNNPKNIKRKKSLANKQSKDEQPRFETSPLSTPAADELHHSDQQNVAHESTNKKDSKSKKTKRSEYVVKENRDNVEEAEEKVFKRPLPLSIYPDSLKKVQLKAKKKAPPKRPPTKRARKTKVNSYAENNHDSDVESIPDSQDPCLITRNQNIDNSVAEPEKVKSSTKAARSRKKGEPKFFKSRSKKKSSMDEEQSQDMFKSSQAAVVEQVFGKQKEPGSDQKKYPDYDQFDELFIEDDTPMKPFMYGRKNRKNVSPDSTEQSPQADSQRSFRTYDSSSKKKVTKVNKPSNSKKTIPKYKQSGYESKLSILKKGTDNESSYGKMIAEDFGFATNTDHIDLPKTEKILKQKKDRTDAPNKNTEERQIEIEESDGSLSPQKEKSQSDEDEANEGDVSSDNGDGAPSILSDFAKMCKGILSHHLDEGAPEDRPRRNKKKISYREPSESEFDDTLSIEKYGPQKAQHVPRAVVEIKKRHKRSVFSDTPDDTTDTRSEVSWLASTARRKKPKAEKTYSYKQREQQKASPQSDEASSPEVKANKVHKRKKIKARQEESLTQADTSNSLYFNPATAKTDSTRTIGQHQDYENPEHDEVSSPRVIKPVEMVQKRKKNKVVQQDIHTAFSNREVLKSAASKRNKAVPQTIVIENPQLDDISSPEVVKRIEKPQKRKRNKAAEGESRTASDNSETLYFKSTTSTMNKTRTILQDVGTKSSIHRDLKAIFSESLMNPYVAISPLELTPTQSPEMKRQKKAAKAQRRPEPPADTGMQALKGFVEDEIENFRFEKQRDESLDLSPILPVSQCRGSPMASLCGDELQQESGVGEQQEEDMPLSQRTAYTHISSLNLPKTPYMQRERDADESLMEREALEELRLDYALTGTKSGPSKRVEVLRHRSGDEARAEVNARSSSQSGESEEEHGGSQSSTRSLAPRRLFDDENEENRKHSASEVEEEDEEEDLVERPMGAVADLAGTDGGLMSMLSKFGTQMQTTMVAKQALLQKFTKQTQKSTQKQIDDIWYKQQEKRARVSVSYKAALTAELMRLEKEVKTVQQAEDEMISFFNKQLVTLRKGTEGIGQGVHQLSKLHTAFHNELRTVEQSQVETQNKVKNSIQVEMKNLQKKLLIQTQHLELQNVKRSLQTMFF